MFTSPTSDTLASCAERSLFITLKSHNMLKTPLQKSLGQGASLTWGIRVSFLPGFPCQLLELSRSQRKGLPLGRVVRPAVPEAQVHILWDILGVQHTPAHPFPALPSGPTLPHMHPKPQSIACGLQLCPVWLRETSPLPTLSRPSGITHGVEKRKTLKKINKRKKDNLGENQSLCY